MRILVLGSTGMLGHKMVERLRKEFTSVIGVSRPAIDANDFVRTRKTIDFFDPNVVINCVGLIKQREHDLRSSSVVNAAFPNALHEACEKSRRYLIHFSTDCVFSGKGGNYTEENRPDSKDIYGITKSLGEIISGNALTIRTSIIGRERNNYKGLLEWFLRQKGDVPGYTNAIFSGVTTNWLADTVGQLLKKNQRLSGLYQVAAPAISKYTLLKLFQNTYGKDDVTIHPVDTEPCDRSLSGEKFRQATGITTPRLEELVYWQRKMDNEESYYAPIR